MIDVTNFIEQINELRNKYRNLWLEVGQDMRKAGKNEDYREVARLSSLEQAYWKMKRDLEALKIKYIGDK